MEFKILKGQTIFEIKGLEKGKDAVIFKTTQGNTYRMSHFSECCESVSIEEIIGDIEDILNSEILLAEEATSDKNPPGVVRGLQNEEFTWTFYKLSTIKGSVTIRWYGESNGYYSTRVDFDRVES